MHNTPKIMGHNESSAKKKVHRTKWPPKNKRKPTPRITNLLFLCLALMYKDCALTGCATGVPSLEFFWQNKKYFAWG